MRISDWSSDVCSSDLLNEPTIGTGGYARQSLSQDDTDWLTSGELNGERFLETRAVIFVPTGDGFDKEITRPVIVNHATLTEGQFVFSVGSSLPAAVTLLPTTPEEERTFKYRIYARRSEEHTSELQSLMRISYAVFCLKKKRIRRK